ncbi:MAG: outer membrane beta-barrel protein [Candidatus Kapabacteria bacterium]|nr:outer membrane beta-barrel protein [Candidatus Kapabacteria bacterium]
MKIFLIFGIIFFLTLLQSTGYSQDKLGTGKTNKKSVKVYEKPDLGSSNKITLSKNTKVQVLEYSNGWYRISLNKKTGWIEESNIEIITKISDKTDENLKPAPVKTGKVETPKQLPKEITINEVPDNPVKESSNLGFNIGFTAGCSISDFNGNDAPSDKSSRLGLVVGAIFINHFSDNVFLEADLLYSNKGAHIIENTNKVLLKFDYIEIPLLLNIKIPYTEIIRVAVGGYIGYNFNAAKITPSETFMFSDIKKIDYGIAAGLGFDLKIFNNSFFISSRYSLGLTTVHNASQIQLDLKNNAVQICIGWMIPYKF